MKSYHLRSYLLPLVATVSAFFYCNAVAQQLMCSFERLPSTCYTECPSLCHSSKEPCPLQCVAGCFCPPHLSQLGSKLCVEPENCLDMSGVDDIPEEDKCSVYDDCNECISSDPDCQWCPYSPSETAVVGNRCRQRGVNPVCPEEIINPDPQIIIVDNEDFSERVQVRPQKLRLELRAGRAENFMLRFQPSRNFPLDVYFLLDATGSFSQQFKITVTPLAERLVDALRDISENFAVAFGIFGDKRSIPFAFATQDPRAYREGPNFERCTTQLITDINDCNPTISFRHTNDFSSLSDDELQEVLTNITIHPNIDTLEGGMDALVQVLTCSDTIGWRENSLRMLLYMTNANFHLAGDGKVGAVLLPNPAECSLEEREENGRRFYEYNQDVLYDYPSVYQLRELIQQTQTNIVFAISDIKSPSPYDDLKKELNLGALLQITELESDASNLVSVIRSSYNNITQEIRLTLDKDLPEVTFDYSDAVNCTLLEDGVCSDVTLDSSVSLLVTVNMTSCLPNITRVNLRSAAFGSVELELVPLCQCDCSLEEKPDAEECSFAGDLMCGACTCDDGRSGSQCECENITTNTCTSETVTLECSGRRRGECDCGNCVCYVQDELLRARNMTERYFGDQCQCDHLNSCGGINDDGQFCSGRGECNCKEEKCECTATGPISGRLYDGDMCECNPDFCYNPLYPNSTCAYIGNLPEGEADCGCNECLCDVGGYNAVPSGEGTCIPGPAPCVRQEPCARCAKNLQLKSTDCNELRNVGCDPILLANNDTVPETHDQECTFQDNDGCTHTFYISSTLLTVFVEPERSCGSTEGGLNNLVWIIPVSIIGALLILGLLALLIVLCVFWIMDRLEFRKFQHNLEEADWVPQENPIYVSPNQQYTNIAYKRPSLR